MSIELWTHKPGLSTLPCPPLIRHLSFKNGMHSDPLLLQYKFVIYGFVYYTPKYRVVLPSFNFYMLFPTLTNAFSAFARWKTYFPSSSRKLFYFYFPPLKQHYDSPSPVILDHILAYVWFMVFDNQHFCSVTILVIFNVVSNYPFKKSY